MYNVKRKILMKEVKDAVAHISAKVDKQEDISYESVKVKIVIVLEITIRPLSPNKAPYKQDAQYQASYHLYGTDGVVEESTLYDDNLEGIDSVLAADLVRKLKQIASQEFSKLTQKKESTASILRDNIQRLLNSDLSQGQISRATGVRQSNISRMSSTVSALDNISLKNAELLSDYWEEYQEELRANFIKLKFNLIKLKLQSELEDWSVPHPTYVTTYQNLAEYSDVNELDEAEALTDILDKIDVFDLPSEEDLESPFIIIDESNSTRFDFLSAAYLEEKYRDTAIVYYQHGADQFDYLGTITSPDKNLTPKKALKELDISLEAIAKELDWKTYDTEFVKIAY